MPLLCLQVMRRYGIEGAYEKLKEATRGKAHITKQDMMGLVETLDIPAEAKQRLQEMSPSSYTGLASSLAQHI